ncbi:MAG TPA: hypothetical protein VE287_04610 [Actinopolymorphaceae bacterium]|nr:hypothetical protein [Actinopolymorphaceae bacterium]
MADRVIRHSEVDGVPTLIAPPPASGEMLAGLTFRVGRADESHAQAGITHLVEHLALHRHGLTNYHFNGATGTVVTHFHMQGSQSDIVSFLGMVCESLIDLPVERLAMEKEILRTEARSRTPGASQMLHMWRYGARGYGMESYPEWGVHQLDVDDVRRWAESWFTRDNAVLWIAGNDIPRGLALRMRDGARRPVPAPSSALPETPAYFQHAWNGVVFDGVVRRSTPATMFSELLRRELFQRLRQEAGLSYTTQVSYDPRDGEHALVTALADALPEKQGAVVGGFVDTLAALRVGRIDPNDIESVRAKAEESLSHPNALASQLPSYALNLLTDHPSPTVEDLRTEIRAVTEDTLRDVAVEMIGTGLIQIPEGHTADWAGFAPAPGFSDGVVTGSRHKSRQSEDTELVIGPDGASVVTPHGPATVRYRDCVAHLMWPDGARQLIGVDGMTVVVEPTMYVIDQAAVARLDATVPADVVVALPARDPESIPRPAPRPAPVRTRAERVMRVVFLVLAILAAVVSTLFTLVTVFSTPEDDLNTPSWYGTVVVCWLISGWLFLRASGRRLRRRPRAARS